MTSGLGEVCHCTCRSNFFFSPGSGAHLQCSHGGDPEGEPSSERRGRGYSQMPVPLPHCPWILSGYRPFHLFIMQFLILVLASGDEKDEGKEPEMEEFVDTKGI